MMIANDISLSCTVYSVTNAAIFSIHIKPLQQGCTTWLATVLLKIGPFDVSGANYQTSCCQMRILSSKYTKMRLRPGICPRPHWGSLQHSLRCPSSWWGWGLLPPPPKTPPPLWASSFWPLALKKLCIPALQYCIVITVQQASDT